MGTAVSDPSGVRAIPDLGPVAIDADAAMEDLYKSSYLRLVRHLYAMTGDLDEAQEVVQEAFVRAVAKAHTALAADDPEAWIRTVARNLARTRFKRRTWMRRFLRGGRHPSTSAGPSPDRVAVVAGMKQLSPPLRETVGLFYLADLSIEDISVMLKIPVGTVKARLSRGRTALAAILGKDSDTHGQA